ncbi:MAG: SMC family ATPase [Thermoplasmata archaeon]|nr:SMC family ATPase [Thermoplasmata archaeon]
MRLISMELHNFRKFKHAEINFPEGIMGLVGSNGAGKSTIIEAIGWAIYGNRAARTKKDMIKRQNASPNEECWVKLVFEMGGNVYEVFRMITRNSTDARVKVNGRITASSTQGVTEYLEKMLGMDYDSFYTSIVARQQELNALSNKQPGERKKSMMKMLGIDVLDDAIKRVREDRRSMERSVEYLEQNLKDMEELERTREELKKKREEYVKRTEELYQSRERAEEAKRKAEERRREEREKAEKFKKLDGKRNILRERKEGKERMAMKKEKELEELTAKEEEYARLKIYVEEYRKLKEKKEQMEEARRAYLERKSLEEQIKEIEEELKNLDGTIQRLEKQMEGMAEEEALERVRKERKEIQGRIKAMEMERERIGAEIKSLERRKKEMERKREEMENLGPESNCPTCGRPLGEVYEEILEEYVGEISEIEKEMRRMEEEKEALTRELEALREREMEAEKTEREKEEEVRERGNIVIKIKSYMENKEEKRAKREEMKRKISLLGEFVFDENTYQKLVSDLERVEKLKDKAIVLEGEISKIPSLREEMELLRKDIEQIGEEIAECEREIEKINFIPEEYERVEREYEEAINLLNSINVEITRIEGKIETVEAEIKKVEEEMEEQKEMRDKIKEMRKQIGMLETLAGDRDTGLLNNFKNYLISKIGPLLSHYASHFLSLFTDGKYKEIEIDDNYNILIYDRGEKFELDRFSGGEKDVANLSLRLAISELIVQRSDVVFEFIALDEIFGSQDRERRKNILNALAELKKQFRQIILITHIDEIKEAMEHIIRVYEDDEGISHISIE